MITGIALETHAMDLAPRDRKGYFLGTWLAMRAVGQIAWGLVVGAAMLALGTPLAVGIAGLVLLGAAAFLAVSRPPPP